MDISDSIRQQRERDQQMMRSVLNRIEVGSDEDVKREAAALLAAGVQPPEYRDPYPGENARHHAAFVTARLRLIYAMGKMYENEVAK